MDRGTWPREEQMTITENDDGWILLENGDDWVNIPPDGLEHPYGEGLPTPTNPQNVNIGHWLMDRWISG